MIQLVGGWSAMEYDIVLAGGSARSRTINFTPGTYHNGSVRLTKAISLGERTFLLLLKI